MITSIFEILGTIAFAISGSMAAVKKKMDLLGVLILGITNAIGGGIIRDILIGVTPPLTLTNPLYAFVAIGVSLVIFIPFVRNNINMESRVLVFIDAIGLGTFTVLGCRYALGYENIWLQIFLGVLTGVGGGVLRDIFTAEKPLIFVKHFYAVASLSGALVFSLLEKTNENAAMSLGIAVVVLLRMLAAKYRWHLPRVD